MPIGLCVMHSRLHVTAGRPVMDGLARQAKTTYFLVYRKSWLTPALNHDFYHFIYLVLEVEAGHRFFCGVGAWAHGFSHFPSPEGGQAPSQASSCCSGVS